ncbi:zinc-binding alcohol dehydrogenase family protein [Paenibacillus harenae]|uniref:zinc-binding alcohol dehydrogenase family protein n=1 Tax=Paenibacillus harenae TaxID=306543 RepID=UPI002790BE6E|nr:zinc-binding alcohol dehydrogenase family protein [Paenibacillus harenae]MDQ0060109.1 2-desacetyl-2-hydroxyethyl bacteriochlorophyllide A dehydrogenase [Paenibacillus harenae]
MKSIVCEQVDRLQVVEQEEPALGGGEAIVRIRRIGICGTDLHAYKGNQPFFTYPRVLGHELSGIVEQVDDSSGKVKAGDQVSIIPYMHCGHCIACRRGKTNCCTDMKVLGVHIDGGMRERIAVPVTHLLVVNELSLDEAALLEPLSIGAHAVRRSGLGEGDTALVIGSGPIGLGVMAFAKHRGAKVIAMDIQEERLAFCKHWAKVDGTVNALHDAKARVAELTDGEYPTVVFDATGNARSMQSSFDLVSHGGTLVYVGLVKADLTFNDPDFHKREMTLMGSRNATPEDFAAVKSALQSGSIDAGSYITHRIPFDELPGQFDALLKPESKVIKAMAEL